jgi:hypothetical protein
MSKTWWMVGGFSGRVTRAKIISWVAASALPSGARTSRATAGIWIFSPLKSSS